VSDARRTADPLASLAHWCTIVPRGEFPNTDAIVHL